MSKNLWDRKKTLMSIKVGSFFLIGLSLFFVVILSVKEINLLKGTYTITIKFDFAEGMRSSSPVRFCGVDVGEVDQVEVKTEKQKAYVHVKAKILNDVRIPKDSYFFINSLSLFGEKYLEISPPPLITGYIEKDEVVEGISPIPLFDVFAGFTKTMREIREFVKEGKIKTSLENTLSNIESISEGLKNIVIDMQNKKGTIGRLFYDDSLYEKTEEFIEDIKQHPWKLLHKSRN